MRKQFFKHFFQFTAAMSLCAAVLAGTPFTGTSEPETGDSITQTGAEEPGITPQNDLEPELTNEQ